MATPLFCPFCGECFEDVERCPDHDIPLIGFDALQQLRAAGPTPDDHVVSPADPRFGRGVIAAGALCMFVGFFLPLISRQMEDDVVVQSGLSLASGVAINLWIVPVVAMTLLSLLLRRRTPASMRGARIVVPILALLPALSLAFTFHRAQRAVDAIYARTGVLVELAPALGALLIAVGVALAMLGGLRFGAQRPDQAPPRYRVQ